MRPTTLLAAAMIALSSALAPSVHAGEPDLLQWADQTNASSSFHPTDCDLSYCISKLLGPPDAGSGCGGDLNAWAPIDPGNEVEWVKARFDVPVYATGIEIHERGNGVSGFVKKIEVYDLFGQVGASWEGTDSTPCAGTLMVNFTQTQELVKSLYFETQIEGYEQIDAIKLIGVTAEGNVLEQWASDASASSSYGEYWTTSMAEGPPNPNGTCADNYYHWVPSSGGTAPEYLEAFFDVPVHATIVRVYEGWNAPFVTAVELLDVDGGEHLVWMGTDTTSCPGVFEISISPMPYLVKGVRIHTQSPNYEEIDAVQLGGNLPTPDCSAGTVNAGAGAIANVLYLNGSHGGSARRVEVQEGEPVYLSLLKPSAGGNGKFVVHAYLNSLNDGQPRVQPFNIGTTCFPLINAQGLSAAATWSNLGRTNHLGVSHYFDGTSVPDPAPAPTTFLDLPNGDTVNLPAGTTVTFQGAMVDPGSAGSRRFSVTNAVTLEVK